MLNQQRAELERLGYTTVSQTEDEVVGVRTRWFWDCLATSLTLVVVLRSVESLTAAMLEEDSARLVARARDLDPSSLPLGFQKGRAVVAIYEAGSVEPAAQRLCAAAAKVRFATFFFPAAAERSSGSAHYFRGTPLWGGLYYGKLRYLVQRLIDPPSAPAKEPISAAGVVLGLGMLVFLAGLCLGCGLAISFFLSSLAQWAR